MVTGVLCCSAAAVLLLTSTSPFSSPPDFLFFSSSIFWTFLLPSLVSLLIFALFSFAICLFFLFLVLCLSLLPLFFCPLFCFLLPTSLQVSECNWPSRQAPSLHNLFAVCKNMHNWLKQNPKNVCVITCSVRRCSHKHASSYSSLSNIRFFFFFIHCLDLCPQKHCQVTQISFDSLTAWLLLC